MPEIDLKAVWEQAGLWYAWAELASKAWSLWSFFALVGLAAWTARKAIGAGMRWAGWALSRPVAWLKGRPDSPLVAAALRCFGPMAKMDGGDRWFKFTAGNDEVCHNTDGDPRITIRGERVEGMMTRREIDRVVKAGLREQANRRREAERAIEAKRKADREAMEALLTECSCVPGKGACSECPQWKLDKIDGGPKAGDTVCQCSACTEGASGEPCWCGCVGKSKPRDAKSAKGAK